MLKGIALSYNGHNVEYNVEMSTTSEQKFRTVR